MEERDRVAIGTVAMRNKQYLTAIRPLDGVLAMSTMRFADEVVPRREIDELPSRRSKPAPKELKMAMQLLDSLASDWDPKQYKDTYVDELRERIEAKEAGEEIVAEEPTERAGRRDRPQRGAAAQPRRGPRRASGGEPTRTQARKTASNVARRDPRDLGGLRTATSGVEPPQIAEL